MMRLTAVFPPLSTPTLSRRLQQGSLALLLLLTTALSLAHITATKANSASATPTDCNLFPVNITKSVTPANPDTGSPATLQFTLADLNAKPVDIALLYDVSSSMRGSKLTAAQTDGTQMVQAIAAADRTAVITFATTPALLQPLTADKTTATTAINSLIASGGSNLSVGLQLAYEELINASHHNPNAVKAILIFSDGRIDSDDIIRAQTQIEAARACGILIYTIGYGTDVDPTTLQQAATHTDGRYSFTTAFNPTTTAQEITIAQHNIQIQDELPPLVVVNCAQVPPGWACSPQPDGTTHMRYQLGDERPLPNPLTLSFPITINLAADFEAQFVNTANSCVAYDGPGNPACQPITNPPLCIQPVPQDSFEPDDVWGEFVLPVSPGEPPQRRNFSHSQDTEWIRTELVAGKTYTFATQPFSTAVGDRQLDLYYLLNNQLVFLATGLNQLTWSSDSLTPTPTPTTTPTGTPTATPTITPTATPTGTPTATAVYQYLPTILHQHNATPIPLHLLSPQDDPLYLHLQIRSATNQFGCGTQYELEVTAP